MKQIVSTICAFLALAAVPLFAAKRIQTESTDLTNNKVTTTETLVDADRMRFNTGDTSVMFLTKGGSRLVMLDRKANTYTEMDKATMDQMAKQLAAALGPMEEALKNMPPAQRAQMEQMLKGKLGPATAPAPIIYTAKGAGNAVGFRCTNYEGNQGGQKVSEICAAQPADLTLSPGDFQVMEKMKDYMTDMMKAMQNSPLASLVSTARVAPEGIAGYPVQTTIYQNGKAVNREVLKSLQDATFTDADFSTGSAKKTELPIPGAPKGKGR